MLPKIFKKTKTRVQPKIALIFIFIIIILGACNNTNSQNTELKQIANNQNDTNIIEQQKPQKISEIPTPPNFKRIETDSNSYASYLRNLPIKQENNIVYLYNGKPKYNQNAHYAVLDIDVGDRDLQQCADAVMRVRAEYLYKNKMYEQIHFNFLSDGKPRYYKDYTGNDRSYKKFRKYMDYIFAYANTASLIDEMQIVEFENMQIGDIFIQKKHPYGHAITVVDMAKNTETGEIIFMLSQSYMPAQEIHILKNFNNQGISPWYSTNFANELKTPEWTFYKNDLRRFIE